jgi:multidrug efflux pump subunit AcrA (membrane-fusion protein)
VRFDPGEAERRQLVHALGDPIVGWVRLAARPRELLVVPTGAVLYSSHGPYLLVPAPDGRGFDRRPVVVGRLHRGLAVIVSGLTDQDTVVTANAFFVDAEQRLRPGRDDGEPVTR